MNIYQIIQDNADKHPDKTAIIFENREISYAELITKASNLAYSLSALGVDSSSRIAFFCTNRPEFAFVLIACARLGCAVAPLPVTLKGTALQKALESTQANFVIAWHSTCRTILERHLIPADRAVVIGSSLNETININELTKSSSPPVDLPAANQISADQDYILTLTSGSTGQPKPIVFSQDTKIRRAFEATQAIYNLSQDDCFLVSTPLYHSLAQRSLLAPMMLGASCVILPKFSVPAWLDAVQRHQVTFLFAVSSQLIALQPKLTAQDLKLSSLRCIVSSSATLEDEQKKILLQRLECAFHECYGASELGVVSDFDIQNRQAPSASVGKALPFVDIRICDDNRQQLPSGQIGEIACKTTTAFKGYLNQPTLTQAAHDNEGYFYTGDLGYLDEAGYLYFSGRKKDMIKSGGISIYPRDIESVIEEVPGIKECAAIGVPDEQMGEVIWLAYALEAGVELNELTLMKTAMAELLDYQQPRRYIRMEALPRTELGKILKPRIRDLFSELN